MTTGQPNSWLGGVALDVPVQAYAMSYRNNIPENNSDTEEITQDPNDVLSEIFLKPLLRTALHEARMREELSFPALLADRMDPDHFFTMS